MISLLLLSARSAIAVFLLTAAITKGLDLDNTRASLAAHFGLRRARRLAPTLIAGEVVVAAGILTPGITSVVSSAIAAALFAGFAAFTLRLARDKDRILTCGCFGLGIPSRSGRFGVGRNAVLGVVAGLLVIYSPEGASFSTRLNSIPAGIAFSLLLLATGALDTIHATREVYLPAGKEFG